MKKGKIFKGAFVISVGALICKIFGAIYRVPLTSLLGAEGLGVYQMAFPVYAMLLDISSAGVPNALSSLISKDENRGKKYLSISVKLFGVVGVVASILMFVLSKPLATFQGNKSAFYIYQIIAPSIVFVSLTACFRGYFQGHMKMLPTSLSQMAEQVVKVGLGLTLISLVSGVKDRVFFAGVAVTVSEVAGLLTVLIIYVIYKAKNKPKKYCLVHFSGGTVSRKSTISNFDESQKQKSFSTIYEIVKRVLPITAISALIPLSQIVDSALMIRLIGSYKEDAVSIFGLFSGAVTSIINLPVSICYGLAVVAVPVVSKGHKNAKLLILSTLVLSALGGICCYLFSPFAVRVLFPKLSTEYKVLTYSLIRASSPIVVLSSLLQTVNSILIAKDKTYRALLGVFIGVVVKIVAEYFLLKIPSLNIYGEVIALILCYSLACFFNLLYIKKYADKENSNGKI